MFRAETPNLNSQTRKLEGYAAVFEQRTEIIPGVWEEEFAVGSFDEVLASQDLDTRGLFNHNPDLLLGRSSADTLRMSADDHGVHYELDLPDTSVGRDVYVLAERGDLTGASIQFIPGDLELLDSGKVERHTRVNALYDISPVTFPAYAGTETEARSRLIVRQQEIRRRAIVMRHRTRNG